MQALRPTEQGRAGSIAQSKIAPQRHPGGADFGGPIDGRRGRANE